MLRIAFGKATESACACCGGTTTSLTRFVYRDDDAFAVYVAAFSTNHPDQAVVVVVSLGEWGDGGTPERRRAFAMRITRSDHYEVMVTNAAECPWHEAEVLGRVLDREEALADPWLKDAFQVSDLIVVEDLHVKDYLEGPAA
jgi:hypothetical protein